MKSVFILIFIALVLTNCVQENENNSLGGIVDDEKEFNEVMSKDTTDFETVEQDTITLEQFTDHLIDLLAENKIEEFAHFFHPEKGTYFSPYTFLDTMVVNYKTNDFINDLNNNVVNLWGEYDGSGEPIKLSIKDYFKQFVYNLDFKTLTSQKNINSKLVYSNTLNNIKEIFPNAEYVEYYYKGSGNYDGMDWASLIFYVEQFNGKYYLVAVVHNQWTI